MEKKSEKMEEITIDFEGKLNLHFTRSFFTKDRKQVDKLIKSQIPTIIDGKDFTNPLSKWILLQFWTFTQVRILGHDLS